MNCGRIIPAMIKSQRRTAIVAGAIVVTLATLLSTACQAQTGIKPDPKKAFKPAEEGPVAPQMGKAGLGNAGRLEVKRPFRENVTLPVDSNLLKRFGTIEDLLADQRWAEAIVVLQEIAQTESKSLVLVRPGKVGEVATYLNVATRCNVLMSRIPAEGRVDYRKKVDPQAKRWYENWLRTRDEAELMRIVRQAFLSSYADEALLELGEAAWDRGDFSLAQSWWEQLVPLSDKLNPADYPTVLRYPDSNLDRAAILARIILCSIMRRETDRAQDELLQFVEQYPEAEGQIAGQHGKFVEILQKTLFESRTWKPTLSSAEVATFGLSFERYQRIPESVDVGAMRWARSLAPNLLPNQPGRLPFQNECLSYHPVVYDNRHEKIVIVNDADAIRAWNILTGEPAWNSENPDPAVIYPAFPEASAIISEMRSVGVPHYTLTIADDRLYARMGSPVTCSSNNEARRELPSDLVCLDLKQEGKLLWKVAAHELFPGAPTWRYEGTPVVFGGRAYVAVSRRHPQLELMIVSLDANDGRLLWQRPIGAFRASVDDSINRISHLLLTAGGGRIFLSTDLGAIVALDAHDGRLEWALAYESRIDDPNLAPGESSRIGLTPALYHGGLLFVAPVDSNSAYCIEADSGRIRWQYPYLKNGRRDMELKLLRERQWKHLLGVVPGGMSGQLIVSGNSVWAIDIETGTLAWSPGDSALKRGARGPFGRGLIAGNQVLFPTRESIEFFELRSGELTRTVLLKTPESAQQGGNLVWAGGILLVAQPNRLAAFGEYSQLKELIEDDLTSNPGETAIGIRLAELEATEGQLDAAISRYRKLLIQLDPADPKYLSARMKFSKQLRELGSNNFHKGNLATARDLWRDAFSMADDIPMQIELIFELARADEALDGPAAEVQELQRILSNELLSKARYEKTTAGVKAARAISRLISERGRDVYRDIETTASTEFDLLRRNGDRFGLHQLVARYPNAEVVTSARQLAVRLRCDAGEFSEAFAVLDEIRRDADDERSLVESTIAILELLQRAGYTNSMKPFWRFLAKSKLEAPADFAGTNQYLSKLAIARLEQLEPKTRTQPRLIERTWSIDFPANSRVIIPMGEPVSPSLTTVIVCFHSESTPETWNWRCVDWQTGNVRWEVTAAEPISVAQWTPVHLLFGTMHGWQARSAEDGRKVWEQSSSAQVTPRLFGTPSNSAVESFWPTTFDNERGLLIFDPNDGNQVAKLKPPGKLSDVVGFGKLEIPADQNGTNSKDSQRHLEQQDSDRLSSGMISLSAVVMETMKPKHIWIATATSPRDEWFLKEISEGSEPWRDPPFIYENRLIGLTKDNCLSALPLEAPHLGATDTSESDFNELEQPANRWSFRNFSSSHAAPVIASSTKNLLVVVDGARVVSFDPLSGSRKWFAGLTDLPMKHPAEQITMDQKSVFATGQGILRAISIHDGSIRFERYLGNVEQQWRTSVAWEDPSEPTAQQKSLYEITPPTSIVAAWTTTPANDHRYTISLCNGLSGALLQQLRVEHAPQGILIESSGRGILWTDRSIIGLRFSSASTMADIGLNSKD